MRKRTAHSVEGPETLMQDNVQDVLKSCPFNALRFVGN